MTVKEFVQTIDSTLEVVHDDEFSVDIDESTIYIGTNTDPVGDRLIQEFVEEEFGITMDPFLIGVLHEVFHIITYEEDLDNERSMIYHMLQLNFKEECYEEYSRMYFSIPSEYAATEGAVNYYLTHKEFCDNFMNERSANEIN